MVILDRKLDFLTPFCTQYSYQGQIDEHFGINFNKVVIPKSLLDFDEQPATKDKDPNATRPVYMTPVDIVFDEIKDYSLDVVRKETSQKLIDYKQKARDLAFTKDTNVLEELAYQKKYMRKYKEHFALAMHVESTLQEKFNLELF